MNPETKRAYLSLANHFYKTRLSGQVLSLNSVTSALLKAAPEYRPDYFRRLKNAVAYDAQCRGRDAASRKILTIQNPVTCAGSTLKKKAKAPRAKSFSFEDFKTLASHLAVAGCNDETVALMLTYYTGARPCELRSIRTEGEIITITGAKKSHEGLRGADRILVAKSPFELSIIQESVLILNNSERSIAAIRDRLRLEARKLWPRRKLIPTLYSLRHQLAANLKASGMSDKEMAYIMGHQSVHSISRYGNRKQGNPKNIWVRPANNAQLNNIRGSVAPQTRHWLDETMYIEKS